jgi:putative copper resistance protein D
MVMMAGQLVGLAGIAVQASGVGAAPAAWTGPGELTASSALSTWQVDIPAVVVILLLAWLYLAGVRAVRRGGGRWSWLRTASFVLGVLILGVTTCSFVGVYARVLFWDFALQVCLLLVVVPIFLGAAAPVSLAAAALPPVPRRVFARLGRSRVARALRLPGVGPLLLILVTVAVFFTPLLQASLNDDVTYHLVLALILVVGVVMALPVTDEGLLLSSHAYAAMLGLAFVELLADAFPGLLLRLHSGLLASGYWTALGRPWGPTLLTDQHQAGIILWSFAEAGDLPFFAVILVAWIRADTREAARIDQALDAASRTPTPMQNHGATGTTATSQAPGGAAQAADPEMMRPWWETDADPTVFGEHRARQYRAAPTTRPADDGPTGD